MDPYFRNPHSAFLNFSLSPEPSIPLSPYLLIFPCVSPYFLTPPYLLIPLSPPLLLGLRVSASLYLILLLPISLSPHHYIIIYVSPSVVLQMTSNRNITILDS